VRRVSELQCFYFDNLLHVKLDLELDPRLTLGEAHAVGRLVRSRVLAACPQLADVDVDLELDDDLGG
jgi:divalent metal cation (Fe/Co/Zn/Cd) transporter